MTGAIGPRIEGVQLFLQRKRTLKGRLSPGDLDASTKTCTWTISFPSSNTHICQWTARERAYVQERWPCFKPTNKEIDLRPNT